MERISVALFNCNWSLDGFFSVSFNGLEKAINSTISGLWLKSFEGQSNAACLQSRKLFFLRCHCKEEGFDSHVQSVGFFWPQYCLRTGITRIIYNY